MSTDTLTMNVARQTVAAKAWQNIIAPLELLQVKMEARLQGEELSENELVLRALQQENNRLELQQRYLAALAVAMMYEKHIKTARDSADE
ncbi:MAG: hypothetical protein FWD06_00490 [Oscillospiraceae bacterium]|nr:hypothetical protein [Oscillospiraceae bacterium]